MSVVIAETHDKANDEAQKRPRIQVDADEDLRQALIRRANKLGLRWNRKVSLTDAVQEILRRDLAPELAELRQEGVIDELPPEPRRKPGRPRKA